MKYKETCLCEGPSEQYFKAERENVTLGKACIGVDMSVFPTAKHFAS